MGKKNLDKSLLADVWSIGILVLLMTIVSSNLNWGKNHWNTLIESDGKGYYAYLPAIFIYDDLHFDFYETVEKGKYDTGSLNDDYRVVTEDGTINKYFCGVALAASPFFALAHVLSLSLGMPADGYSKLYPILINIASLFYLLLGLIFLNASLRFFQILSWQRALTLFAMVFGSNLFYYTVSEPAMSHIYSFAFISAFVYGGLQYFQNYQRKYFLGLALVFGMIVLIRPVNGLIIFALPFLAGTWPRLVQGVQAAFRNWPVLVLGLGLSLAIISLQIWYYQLATGNYWVYSYRDEGFNFSSPQFWAILFSYRKGLFLYTPIYFVSLAGMYVLWQKSKFRCYALLAFFTLITYVFSSWWMWYYGGSFSSRVYVEYLPLFMILLALALSAIPRGMPKVLFVSLLLSLMVVCQIQTYQYRYYQIHWSDMTKEKYWDVFLRIDKL